MVKRRLVDMSLPTRERGLKCLGDLHKYVVHIVAPYAGAWIEISTFQNHFSTSLVAPYAGAWIEIR